MDEDFPTLIKAYLADSEQRYAEMEQAVARADMQTLWRAAHSLKGSSSNLGAGTLAALCLALELQAKRGELFGLPEQLEGIRKELNSVAAELERELFF